MNEIDERLHAVVAEQPYPLMFATISGSHLYGFSSADSDFDLRGVHVLPASEVLGLAEPRETIEVERMRDGMELDLVTHDAKKFFGLMLKKNGYVLEQLCSPLVVHTTPEHQELLEIAPSCVTRHHAHHYLGFAQTQWKLFHKENPRRVKPLLYVFRVILTGVNLMRTHKIEANLPRLNDDFKLSYLDDLIAIKTGGKEKETLPDADVEFFQGEYERLLALLEEARNQSTLPEKPTGREALSDLLVRMRMASMQ